MYLVLLRSDTGQRASLIYASEQRNGADLMVFRFIKFCAVLLLALSPLGHLGFVDSHVTLDVLVLHAHLDAAVQRFISRKRSVSCVLAEEAQGGLISACTVKSQHLDRQSVPSGATCPAWTFDGFLFYIGAVLHSTSAVA
jgi:hypothetical protein